MGELIFKSNLNQDWISFALIFNIFLTYLLVKINPIRTTRLFNFLKTDLYFSKYNSERETQYLNPYNIVGTLIILNTISLSFIFFSEKIIYKKTYFFEFCFIFLLLTIFLVVRYLLTALMIKRVDFWKKIKPLIFKNFTLNLQYAYLYFGLILFGFYSKIPSLFLFSFVGITLISWFLSQTRLFLTLFKFLPKEVFYFILYLCIFKIIPWYCFYLFVLEPRY